MVEGRVRRSSTLASAPCSLDGGLAWNAPTPVSVPAGVPPTRVACRDEARGRGCGRHQRARRREPAVLGPDGGERDHAEHVGRVDGSAGEQPAAAAMARDHGALDDVARPEQPRGPSLADAGAAARDPTEDGLRRCEEQRPEQHPSRGEERDGSCALQPLELDGGFEQQRVDERLRQVSA